MSSLRREHYTWLLNNLEFTIWPSMRKSERNYYKYWDNASRQPVMKNATPIRPSIVPGSLARNRASDPCWRRFVS